MRVPVRLIVLTFVVIGAALVTTFKTPRPNPVQTEPNHYHAGFVVYVNGVKQDYSSDAFMYRDTCPVNPQQGENVMEQAHLHNNIGDVAHVHRSGVTWRTLFANLGQEFAASAQVAGYRNGQRVLNILDSPILPDESVIVVVGSESGIDLGNYVTQQRIAEVSQLPEVACGQAAVLHQQTNPKPQEVARDLQVPWEIAFLPDGELIVTERPGRLRFIEQARAVQVDGVVQVGEGGLLGLAVDPDFSDNQYIYIYLTTRENGRLVNQVRRYRLSDFQLSQMQVVVTDIPAASNHNGGRLAFGPDGYLYIGTGDAGQEVLAQDRTSLAGKILRVDSEGRIPPDNPFGNAVYSYGHRNVQGLAWDDTGQLWATEHGRSGVRSGLDELNRIEKGGNYGWPLVEGDETQQELVSPVIHSGARITWAPAGLAYKNGVLYFAGLRGQTLYRYEIASQKLDQLYKNEFGRLRAAVFDQDGELYLSTSNRDGRGIARESDDKLILIPKTLL